MRDILITLFVFGSLPFILKRPWLGVLMWVWLSVMNPHRLTWGFAYEMPFAQLVALATLAGLLFCQEKHKFPWTPVTVVFVLFILWMNVTTLFALQLGNIYPQWVKVMKIMLMTLVALYALNRPEHIKWLAWVLVVSLGFYGVKGGVFTLTVGGENRVWGPASTYVSDNNALAVALCMTVPLMWYLRMHTANRWVRHGLLGAMLLCAVAAVGSYSRGALLTIVAMSAFLWLKSRHKMMLAIVILAAAPAIVGFMPEKWFDRMDTIQNYEEDSSALGRLNAWQMAINLAKDRPLVGGGFEVYDASIFARYAPDPTDVHAAHSVYFAALGEHGFVGLGLFLLMGLLSWLNGGWIAKHANPHPELRWAADLALMCQVSLIGYAVGGAFLSLLYFDLPYYLMGLLVLLRKHVESVLAQAKPIAGARSGAPLAVDATAPGMQVGPGRHA